MEEEREVKAACKSNEITGTPACLILAMVTPKASKREQANTKKSKQIRKQQLEYFGQGPRVAALSKEETPIDAVFQHRERGLDHDEGKRGETTSSSDKATKTTKSKKQQQTVDTREVQEAKKRAP